jgi:hypothetical protein
VAKRTWQSPVNGKLLEMLDVGAPAVSLAATE